MIKYLVTTLLVAAPLAAATAATPVDNSRYVTTVTHFEAVVAQAPKDQEAWLNLGMAYRQLGRAADANAAFTKVLQLDNATLQDKFGGDVWSHQLARAAMSNTSQMAAR